MSTAIGILGTGAYFPSHVVTNEEVGGPAGVTDEWIRAKTGIHSRRRAKPDEATSDLATYAARTALEDAGVRAQDVSLIVVATTTPDMLGPACACMVAGNLECPVTTAAFDLHAACSGFPYALSMAERHIRAEGGHALVIGADTYTRFLNPADPRTVVLWGDGGGAVVLGPVPEGRGLIRSRLMSHGAEFGLATIPGIGSREPIGARTLAEGRHYVHMNGRRITEIVKERVPGLVADFLAEAGVDRTEVDHLIPHQGNDMMVRSLGPMFGLDNATVHSTSRDYGNTGSASIPVTLDQARRAGDISPGDTALLVAFGAGITFGFTLLRWQ
ncbi:ketoacyl-ACP synthase III [Actinacidiphila sp. DG2A-62]|jgi:3-oxoacyl-[acyl-carrier-protein] synthase-3|uniref:3-oxoacyl-ACP synthase III family protein n=1 Tax=Actinacidiphila sp. DG2A-62 TaxID=3108821 RepID=UPI002DBE326F|nr:ketoacyl-ACP synthase III [Actinacidiphila sp. DG2A-62]MEC3996922.1 ketoacyl-ACP synthase III [Actinacidiphila sp. DG2A-62]